VVGIVSFGGYIPRLRLQRRAIAAAHAWMNPSAMAAAKGERSMANWDEDPVTMSVEAARDCLQGVDRSSVDAVHLASTTLPFKDRLSSGIVAAALNLSE
jgi:hydroxymethylglutaryl-CoA synthase